MSIISDDTVKGSFHQGDSSHFSDETLGRQCMANAVAAAVYATMLPINYWNPPALDRILIAGDELYRRRCNDQYQYLQFSDIRESEVLFGQQHDMNANASMTGLLQYKYAPSPPFFTLDQAISSMENSQQWTYSILTLADGNDGASVLLCVKQGNYYIFDSHSRDTFGNVVANGTSVLLHMKTHNALMKYIKTIGSQLAATQFEIIVLSPVVSGFHQMLRQPPSSQKSQNKETLQEKNCETKRNTRNSNKKTNIEHTQRSQNEQNKDKTFESRRRSNRNCTNEQNKEKIQNLETSQKEKETSKERAKKYNEIRRNKKEEEKNKRSKRHEKRKNTDEELNRSQKRKKTEKLENNNSSINIENRYNTRSKTRKENTNCETIPLNLSQSNKQKQITDDILIKRR